ncbi:MAG: hypothetical protein JST31_06160 [Actinobacteria bacterium]|nr:hypothetical protein [Actinomycetota bacterium]
MSRSSFKLRVASAAIATSALVLLAPGAALAARTYYVTVNGSGTACTSAEPCSLGQVLATSTSSGDVVVIRGGEGSYSSSTLPLNVNAHIPAGVTWTGEAGHPMPVIYSEAGLPELGAFVLEGIGSKLVDIEIIYSGNTAGVGVVGSPGGGTLERVLVLAGTTDLGCNLAFGTITVVDSVCKGQDGAFTDVGGGGTDQITFRNDTLIGSNGAAALVATNGLTLDLTATNTIFHGAGSDIQANIFAGSIEFTLDHSNYASVSNTGGATITPAGSGTNQMAAPLFVNAAANDFREAPGSPTLDAGLTAAANGSADLAGNPRNVGAVPACSEPQPGPPDIGAYELVPAPLPAASCAPPPSPPPGPSIGAPACHVPKLAGRGLKATRRRLKRADCRLGKVTLRGGVTAKAGKVVKQRPPSGRVRAAGAKVKVTLGQG